MITPNTPAKVEPFSYEPLALGPAPITSQADLDANPDTLRPAWGVYAKAKAIAERTTPELKLIAKNTNLSEAGKRAAATAIAVKELATLNKLLGTLDAPEAVALAQAAEVQKVAALPDATDSDERLAEAFGRKNEQQRIRMLEAAMTGKDPRMLRALATAHHSLSGLGAPTLAILQSQLQGEKLDPAAAERVRDVASKLGTVRRTVTAIIDSLENASDRAQLTKAGVATLRRSDLTTAQKAEHIDKHGLDAFKALSA